MDTAGFLNQIKRISFNERDAFLKINNKDQFISISKALGYMEKPKDWLEIATKCSQNASHEHFGKLPETILEIWQNKSKKGSERGSKLEDYIHARIELNQTQCDGLLELNINDQNLIGKCESFDKVFDSTISKLQHIGNEIWITDKNLNASVRMDALFANPNLKKLYIIDWKNNDEITEHNRFNKYLDDSPFRGFPICDAVKMHFQVHTYKYILSQIIDKMDAPEFEYLKSYSIETLY